MGWRFSLGHVTIVAYVLATDDSSVPRIRVRELQAFLDSVRGVGGEEAFTAANEAWLGDLERAATEASAFLGSLGGEHDAVLNEIEAIRTLAGVRRAIGRRRRGSPRCAPPCPSIRRERLLRLAFQRRGHPDNPGADRQQSRA